MRTRALLPLLILVPFTAWSVSIVAGHGYFGFVHLALREPWAAQMLIDLTIALGVFVGWMRRDARARGLPFLPYLVATLTLGSIGALAYLVHRALRAPAAPAPGQAISGVLPPS